MSTFYMAKCYLGKLVYGEMLLRRVFIWQNVTWRDVTELPCHDTIVPNSIDIFFFNESKHVN